MGQLWGKTLLNGLVRLPLILPPVALTFGKRGPGRPPRASAAPVQRNEKTTQKCSTRNAVMGSP
ncbi:hypothetical protein MesoLj131b_07880 [Mesorhizobium sp. 131-2-5]|nr:hypothetical protein MesoLj131b_07880 [Mesorhizobium sp. 131-2-5]